MLLTNDLNICLNKIGGNFKMSRLRIKRNSSVLAHSAKGSEWENHKYLKRIDGTYYYPDNYEGGRHLSDLEEKESSKKSDESKSDKLDLTENDIEKLSDEVITGLYGNGQTRKDLLGDNYQEVQDRVNKILLGSGKTTTVDNADEASEKKVEKAVEKVTQASKGLNLEQVFSVYIKKK